MSDSPLITCANAIAYELNAAVAADTFNQEFEAKVLWAKRTLKLTELKVLRVDVAPINWTKSLEDRGGWGHVCRYHIGVRKRFVEPDEESTGEIADSEITKLVTLLEDLIGFFMPKQPDQDGRELTQFTDAVWAPEKDLKTDVIIKWDHLEFSQFTGYFPLTFEVST